MYVRISTLQHSRASIYFSTRLIGANILFIVTSSRSHPICFHFSIKQPKLPLTYSGGGGGVWGAWHDCIISCSTYHNNIIETRFRFAIAFRFWPLEIAMGFRAFLAFNVRLGGWLASFSVLVCVCVCVSFNNAKVCTISQLSS